MAAPPVPPMMETSPRNFSIEKVLEVCNNLKEGVTTHQFDRGGGGRDPVNRNFLGPYKKQFLTVGKGPPMGSRPPVWLRERGS